MIVDDKIVCFNGNESWLSNFHKSPIQLGAIEYPTVEHAFQAMKSEDINERRKIAKLDTPGQAKRAGQKVKLRENWEETKVMLMYMLTRKKYLENPKLEEKLIATGSMLIQEGNSWSDTYWGVDIKTGKGINMLGNMIMIVREEAIDIAERMSEL